MAFIYTIEVADSSEPYWDQHGSDKVLCFRKPTRLMCSPQLGVQLPVEVKLGRPATPTNTARAEIAISLINELSSLNPALIGFEESVRSIVERWQHSPVT